MFGIKRKKKEEKLPKQKTIKGKTTSEDVSSKIKNSTENTKMCKACATRGCTAKACGGKCSSTKNCKARATSASQTKPSGHKAVAKTNNKIS